MAEERKSFSAFKSTRGDVEDLTKKILDKNTSQKGGPRDERQYSFNKDKGGNFFGIIRFLPSIDSLPPIVSKWNHFFENAGKWYVENCPSTHKKPCPVCDYNKKFWEKYSKEEARAMIGKKLGNKSYYANILVVKDSVNPENNGRVFVYQFGMKIYNKILSALKPTNDMIEAGIKPINIFDLTAGANFVMKIKTVGGYTNYDDCFFQNPEPISGDDKELERIYNGIISLGEFVEPSAFKTYEQLEERFKEVMGKDTVSKTAEDLAKRDAAEREAKNDWPKDESKLDADKAAPKAEATAESKPPKEAEEGTSPDVDDYFKDL